MIEGNLMKKRKWLQTMALPLLVSSLLVQHCVNIGDLNV
jgi:hypothetical protein